MKVAIVHEWLTIYGGSERVTEVFHEIFPKAPIYCLVYDNKTMPDRFRNYDIRTTFVQKLPFSKKRYKDYLPLMPMAFEELDLTEYDLIISSSTACAKGVITRSDAVHICYCHTPTRYLWEFYYEYTKNMSKLKKIIISMFIHKLRIWDRLAADRVDYFIANSNYIAGRISKYYRRKSKVIFPPVNTHLYNINDKNEEYYLIVSRLVTYKKVDLAVEAFNKLGLPLIIIGDGPERREIEKIASSNIKFLGRLTDEEIREYYSKCKAFIFPGEEDFGLTPVECQASGGPVIAYKKGGALDTVLDEKTGILFREQSVESLIEAVEKFEKYGVEYDRQQIKEYSEKFSVDRFKKEFEDYVNQIINKKM
ncbi:glycosyltransferase [Clostridium beijerinckii]|uniref:glycosyltransferase n=1 Tax=Clostridium beijerinckii TaxID=1520 RepID=UPI001361C1F0|nr:glycosyltransferase [Clostridium beijerinckii]MZK52797.1 glycosyltransferase [Clostridium beijerinckii]MZK60898.1 glycosyltransferase [Clostridium beijerinckii]MZK71104.1 glycosyltransferase [Clostridium beijerinckii]MZK76462.1 glycosyltransferase [Clostridium beijerinckii]MZK85955.1 glycosyltransferase [Clostridium beijerinckii]